jgi:hypothetical protein
VVCRVTSLGREPAALGARVRQSAAKAGHSNGLAIRLPTATAVVSQWFRYPGARVFAFDRGHSLYALTKAAGGRFYDIGEGGLSFQPLRDIDDESEFGWGATATMCL